MKLNVKGIDKETSEGVFSSITKKDGLKKEILEIEQSPLNFLRKSILDIKLSIKDEIGTYGFDYKFGFSFYFLMNSFSDFNETVASTESFWNELCLKCVPDLIYERHGFNPDYYYLKSNRNYLSTMWWFIHLCYQGDKDSTYFVISHLPSTDYIMQLVDRASHNGVYLETTRLIMKSLVSLPIQVINDSKNGQTLFRRVMMQDVAKRTNTNLIYEGKAQEYVDSLFEKCGVNLNDYRKQ
jgi:hypothetical protein